MAKRILVVDEEPLSCRCRAVVALLEQADFAATACDQSQQAAPLVAEGEVDIVLLDLSASALAGFETCRRIKATERGRQVPVLLLIDHNDTAQAVAGLDAGADGYISNMAPPAALVAQVRAMIRFRAAHGPSWPQPSLPELLDDRMQSLSDQAGLSQREQEVLKLLLLGRSASEIGTALGIAARTAKFHQANVVTKLGADSRLDLLRLFL